MRLWFDTNIDHLQSFSGVFKHQMGRKKYPTQLSPFLLFNVDEKKIVQVDDKSKQDCSYQGEALNVPTAF